MLHAYWLLQCYYSWSASSTDVNDWAVSLLVIRLYSTLSIPRTACSACRSWLKRGTPCRIHVLPQNGYVVRLLRVFFFVVLLSVLNYLYWCTFNPSRCSYGQVSMFDFVLEISVLVTKSPQWKFTIRSLCKTKTAFATPFTGSCSGDHMPPSIHVVVIANLFRKMCSTLSIF